MNFKLIHAFLHFIQNIYQIHSMKLMLCSPTNFKQIYKLFASRAFVNHCMKLVAKLTNHLIRKYVLHVILSQHKILFLTVYSMSIFEILQNLADLMTSLFDIQTLITRIQRTSKICFGCYSESA